MSLTNCFTNSFISCFTNRFGAGDALGSIAINDVLSLSQKGKEGGAVTEVRERAEKRSDGAGLGSRRVDSCFTNCFGAGESLGAIRSQRFRTREHIKFDLY